MLLLSIIFCLYILAAAESRGLSTVNQVRI